MLRCKFRVASIEKHNEGDEYNEARNLRLEASNETDGDNHDWSQWTPSGELMMWVTNPSAIQQIDGMSIGDHYYIDISPVV